VTPGGLEGPSVVGCSTAMTTDANVPMKAILLQSIEIGRTMSNFVLKKRVKRQKKKKTKLRKP